MKYLVILIFCFSCTQQKQISTAAMRQSTLVYKTHQNYNDLVPVVLSADKTEIVNYPAPSDLYFNGQLALPTKLKKGYLLDNRGINKNVAFLKITYQEYAKLDKAPSLEELYDMIIDKDPLLELYKFGNRDSFSNLIVDLNDLIKKGELEKYSIK